MAIVETRRHVCAYCVSVLNTTPPSSHPHLVIPKETSLLVKQGYRLTDLSDARVILSRHSNSFYSACFRIILTEGIENEAIADQIGILLMLLRTFTYSAAHDDVLGTRFFILGIA